MPTPSSSYFLNIYKGPPRPVAPREAPIPGPPSDPAPTPGGYPPDVAQQILDLEREHSSLKAQESELSTLGPALGSSPGSSFPGSSFGSPLRQPSDSVIQKLQEELTTLKDEEARLRTKPPTDATVPPGWPFTLSEEQIRAEEIVTPERSYPDKPEGLAGEVVRSLGDPGVLLDPSNIGAGIGAGATAAYQLGKPLVQGAVRGAAQAATGIYGAAVPAARGAVGGAKALGQKLSTLRYKTSELLDPSQFDPGRGPASIQLHTAVRRQLKGPIQYGINVTARQTGLEMEKHTDTALLELGRNFTGDKGYLKRVLTYAFHNPLAVTEEGILYKAATRNGVEEVLVPMTEGFKRALVKARTLLDDYGPRLEEAGLIKGMLDDYFPLMVVEKYKSAPEKFAKLKHKVERLYGETGRIAPFFGPGSRRRHTLQEFNKIIRGAGLTPLEDPTVILTRYVEAAETALAKRAFLDTLRTIPADLSDTTLTILMPTDMVAGNPNFRPLPKDLISKWTTLVTAAEDGKHFIHERVPMSIRKDMWRYLVDLFTPTYSQENALEGALQKIDTVQQVFKLGKVFSPFVQGFQALEQILATQRSGPIGVVKVLYQARKEGKNFQKGLPAPRIEKWLKGGLNISVADEFFYKPLKSVDNAPETRGLLKIPKRLWNWNKRFVFRDLTAYPMVIIADQLQKRFMAMGMSEERAMMAALRPTEEIMTNLARETSGRAARILGNLLVFSRMYAFSFPRIARGAVSLHSIDPALTNTEARVVQRIKREWIATTLFYLVGVPQLMNYAVTGHGSWDNEPGRGGDIALYKEGGRIVYIRLADWLRDAGSVINPAEWTDVARRKLSVFPKTAYKMITGRDVFTGKSSDTPGVEGVEKTIERIRAGLGELAPGEPENIPGFGTSPIRSFFTRFFVPIKYGQTKEEAARRYLAISSALIREMMKLTAGMNDGSIPEGRGSKARERLLKELHKVRKEADTEFQRRDKYGE